METQITRCVCLILCSYLLFTSQYVVRVLALESWRIGTNAPYFKSPWWMENGCGHWVILPGLARCRLRCIADCGNVCQTLKGFLVVLLALVHLRTLFCACYFLPVVDNIDGPFSMQITFAINVYFPVIVINLHMLVSNAAPSLTRKIGCWRKAPGITWIYWWSVYWRWSVDSWDLHLWWRRRCAPWLTCLPWVSSHELMLPARSQNWSTFSSSESLLLQSICWLAS